MGFGVWKNLKKRRAMSRNDRAEKYSRHLRLRADAYKSVMPRMGLGLIFIVATVVLFPPSKRTKDIMFQAGEIADRDLIAPFDFEVPLSDEELKIERTAASLAELPVYRRDRTTELGLQQDLVALFDSLATISAIDTLNADQRVEMAAPIIPYLSRNHMKIVVDSRRLPEVRTAVLDYQQQLFARGLVDNAGPLRRRAYSEVAVLDGNNENRFNVKDMASQGAVDQLIKEEGFRRFRDDRALRTIFTEVVRVHVLPNMTLDVEETEQRREAAMSQVPKTTKVSKNQRIIGKHDKVTDEQERTLVALEQTRASMETSMSPLLTFRLYSAQVLRLLLYVTLFGLYIFVFHRAVYRDMLNMTAVLTVMVIFVIFTAVVVRFQLNPYLVPVAFVALMITALFDYRLGLVATIFSCFLVPLITDLSPLVSFVSLLAGTAAVFGLLQMRSRSNFYSVFTLVSAAYLIGVVATELGQVEQMSELYRHLLWALGNGLFCSLATMFLLPIFEGIFNLTTRFTLLELTDLNKPILKRLNMEAPGTYHHSMLLGSLVDAVAPSVGADPLKARVMAYYHDIGKIFKPEYYAENQEAGFNKHEKITPQMSSLILLSHVKDGVELAREEKLPNLIIDAIHEHHGTTVMAYFYQKALETDSHSSVNKDDFRYPGPKPQSKEAASLMLADTVEPAVRSLSDPSPTNVRNMVFKLINGRAQEGELDESGLTMNDLAKIREKFVSILTGIYHKRVQYPGQEKEEEKQGEVVAKPV